jgi:hypothetical protein
MIEALPSAGKPQILGMERGCRGIIAGGKVSLSLHDVSYGAIGPPDLWQGGGAGGSQEEGAAHRCFE